MKFCPKCGSIMILKKEGEKSYFYCNGCKQKEEVKGSVGLKEKTTTVKKIERVEKEVNVLPKTKAECPKCGNSEAYYWTMQTRAADEAETKFLKCTKCGHTWREYD
ncbi:MAG: transcription factor S [Candidatus Woesearchaeota archaeon]